MPVNELDIKFIGDVLKQDHISREQTNISKVVPDLVNIVPQETFHPKVAVAIDFTHQFTQSSESLQGKRPLDPTMFKNYAQKLISFYNAYLSPATVRSYLAGVDAGEYIYDDGSEAQLNAYVNEIINYFITDVTVSRSRREIGTASITLKDNRNSHGGRNYSREFYSGAADILNQLIAPMLPIMIFSRGRLDPDYYYPIFDGYIYSFSLSDAAGFAEVEIQCKDVLELARTSQALVNPALLVIAEHQSTDSLTLLSKPFYGQDHIAIISAMFAGGHLAFDPPTAASANAEDWKYKIGAAYAGTVGKQSISGGKSEIKGATATTDLNKENGIDLEALDSFLINTEDALLSGANLYVSPASGPVTESSIFAGVTTSVLPIPKSILSVDFILRYVSHKTHQRNLILWGDNIVPYRVWNVQSNQTFTSTFSSRLDVITEVANMVYYDFYVDGAGNVNYHPMRLNNLYLTNDAVLGTGTDTIKPAPYPKKFAQVVSPEEITTRTQILNTEEMITFLRVRGQDSTITNAEGELLNIVGCAVNKELLAKYGYRRTQIDSPILNNNPDIIKGSLTFLDLAAMVLMEYSNAELYTTEVTMIHRPELELAKPIFFTEDNNVFYVNSITHSISIGGEATTNINGSFGRKDTEVPRDLAAFMVQTQKLYDTRGKDMSAADIWKQLGVTEWRNYLDKSVADTLEANLINTAKDHTFGITGTLAPTNSDDHPKAM